MHPRLPSLFILVFLILAGSVTDVAAQADRVEIKNVKFGAKERPWGDYMIEIDVEAKGNPKNDPSVINPNYVDNIKVTLLVGYAHPDRPASAREFIFHEASVVIATMEAKKSRKIAFWIPYDIAQRDNLSKEPEYWVIDLAVNDQDIPVSADNIGKRASRNLNMQSLASMKGIAGSPTKGIMLPGYLSGNGYRESGTDRPPFVRIEEN